MFKHIHFKNFSGTLTYDELMNDPGYQNLLKTNQISTLGDIEYTMDSRKICVLLPTPIPEVTRSQLPYIQSFDYSESGNQYFTKRKDFYSYLLLFTYEGTGELIYHERKYLLETGDIAILDCREPHVYQTKGNLWSHGALHFYGGNSEYIMNTLFFEEDRVIVHPASFQNIQTQLEVVLRTTNQVDPFRTSVELQKLILLISDEHKSEEEQQNSTPESLKYLRLYIEKHFSEDLSLDFLSDLVGITKFHLCREYKRYFGFSPIEYVKHLRSLQAEILLQSSNLPTYRIAQIVGFSSEANFFNHFKKTHHMTPGEYRKLPK